MGNEVRSITDEIRYWLNLADEELHCFTDKERVYQIFLNLAVANRLKWYFLPDKKGLIVYTIVDDFRGGLTVNELFMYIKPKWRGNIRLFKELINHIEQFARSNKIPSVRLASNIGYDDEHVLRVLQHFGYRTDVVVKEV